MTSSNRPHFPSDHTPTEWAQMASDCRRRSNDSFDRCDTDGFLSQWASDTMARRYDALAKIAANGGIDTFVGIVSADNPTVLLPARSVQTRYGWTWAIDTEAGTVWFSGSSARTAATREANDRKKGYLFASYDAPALMFADGLVAPVRDAVPTNVRVDYRD